MVRGDGVMNAAHTGVTLALAALVGLLALLYAPHTTHRGRLAPDPAEECTIAVCLSGTVRTMVSAQVRANFVSAMDALAGDHCRWEILAHVSNYNDVEYFKDRGAVYEATERDTRHAVQRLNSTGKVSMVHWYDARQNFAVPHDCEPRDTPPIDAYYQLHKVSDCFHGCVEEREEELGRRFDWVVRCRYDLAWLVPPPAVHTLDRYHVHAPLTYWPLK